MAQQWKCTACGKKFGIGEWKCADEISNHVVEEKTYRSADAPSDPGHPANGGMDSRRDGQTVVCNIPPARKMGEGADVRWVGEGSVTFIRGRFATSDPEQQYWLDKKPGYNVTEEQWAAAWLSDGQKLEMEKMQLKAERQRLENDRNELLAQTKQKVGAAA
ncbi:MAG TPA: hypothetical protein VN517_16205 [Terriglobales bacterium]|nr:hypothetical protein [Terriglobales bacterium]